MAWRHGMAYSQDLRDRVFSIADGGMSVTQTASLLRVSISYVSKVLSRRRRSGELGARAQVCHVPPKLSGLRDAIGEKVRAEPDATIVELRAWLLASHGVSCSTGLMHETLIQLKLTLKKSRCTLPSRPDQTLPKRVPTGGRAKLA